MRVCADAAFFQIQVSVGRSAGRQLTSMKAQTVSESTSRWPSAVVLQTSTSTPQLSVDVLRATAVAGSRRDQRVPDLLPGADSRSVPAVCSADQVTADGATAYIA